MPAGVYIIRNKENGKVYVGSSVSVEKRIYKHRLELSNGSHPNAYLQRAYSKYGAANFAFEVLMLCKIDDRLKIEQSYIDQFQSMKEEYGYNLIPTRESQLYGEAMGKQMKAAWAKMPKAVRSAIQAHASSPDNIARLRKMSAERVYTPENRAAKSVVATRVFATNEARKAASDRMKARWSDPEFRAQRLAGLDRGREKTNAARRKPR